MHAELWILAYAVIGLVVASFVIIKGGDVTIGDALMWLLLVAIWPLLVIVAVFQFMHDYKVLNLVIWKRK